MRKRRNKSKKLITFHNSYLILALCFILTGYYLNLIVFTSLIIVHEFGHYIMAKFLHFNIDGIIIYPYGGITKINDLINRDINEELLVATAGIITQYLFYLLISFLYTKSYIRDYVFNLYTLYNSRMIFFNLLPIYPLDGAKIIGLLFNKIFNYNLSNKLIILLSLLTIFIILFLNIYELNYSNIMIYLILLSYVYDFVKKRKYLYNKFLLERYLYDIKYSKVKVIDNFNNMYKNKTHVIYSNNKYMGEFQFLKKIFSHKTS